MNREDIIRMALDADCIHVDLNGDHAKAVERLERFAAIVTAANRDAFAKIQFDSLLQSIKIEREACAKLCESLSLEWEDQPNIAQVELATMMDCALAIRARSDAK